MSCETRFFKCEKCGNILGLIVSSGVTMDCCGAEMVELKPNTVDAAQEKHVPVVTVSGNKVTVQVGSVLHPMLPEHYIMWVYLQTEKGGQRKCLQPGGQPIAEFTLIDDKPLAAYEYCNLHGLWKADI